MAKITNIGTGSLRATSDKDLSTLIQKKAYELYEKRGKKSGYALADWLEAERIVKQKRSF